MNNKFFKFSNFRVCNNIFSRRWFLTCNLKELKVINVEFNDMVNNTNAIFRYLLFDLNPRLRYKISVNFGSEISLYFYPLNISLSEFRSNIVHLLEKRCGKGTKFCVKLDMVLITIPYKPYSGVYDDDISLKGSFERGVVKRDILNKPLEYPLVPAKDNLNHTFKLCKRSIEGRKRRSFNRAQARKGIRGFSTCSIYSVKSKNIGDFYKV